MELARKKGYGGAHSTFSGICGRRSRVQPCINIFDLFDSVPLCMNQSRCSILAMSEWLQIGSMWKEVTGKYEGFNSPVKALTSIFSEAAKES